MAKRVGVIMAGCGHRDGGEIHEITCTLLALAQQGAEAVCFAPDANQADVLNHTDGSPMQETRNILVEAARIARGQIQPVSRVNPGELDALILPGGFGVAKNLCTFAKDGAEMTIRDEVTQLVQGVAQAGKPMGFICIAPVIAARLFGAQGVTVTLGTDPQVAQIVTGWGARHVEKPATDIAVDTDLKIVTTPAYMNATSIDQVYTGVSKLVQQALAMA